MCNFALKTQNEKKLVESLKNYNSSEERFVQEADQLLLKRFHVLSPVLSNVDHLLSVSLISFAFESNQFFSEHFNVCSKSANILQGTKSFGALLSEKEACDYIDRCFGDQSWKKGPDVLKYEPIRGLDNIEKEGIGLVDHQEIEIPKEITGSHVRLDKSDQYDSGNKRSSIQSKMEAQGFLLFSEKLQNEEIPSPKYLRLEEEDFPREKKPRQSYEFLTKGQNDGENKENLLN